MTRERFPARSREIQNDDLPNFRLGRRWELRPSEINPWVRIGVRGNLAKAFSARVDWIVTYAPDRQS